jgi:hypothetical protein
VKTKTLGLAVIMAAGALPAFGAVVVPVPEGGADMMYLLLAGVFCFGAVFLSRHQRSKS